MAHAAVAPVVKPSLELGLRIKLSVMMFLQFATWGAWAVTIGPYLEYTLHFNRLVIGGIQGAMALGTIIAPLFVGQVADRFFSSERLMAVLHLVGAALLYWQSQIENPTAFYIAALAYAFVYSPTLALSNSIAFSHVPDGGRDFPGLRVLGTVGWIAAGWIVGGLGGLISAKTSQPFILAACFSWALGIFSFMLPHTPPPGKAGDALPFLKALGLFKDFNFAVFFGVSFVITVVLAFYYNFLSIYLKNGVGLSDEDYPRVMTIGQFAELLLLPFLPFFLKRWGMKWVLAVGMFCWGVRYVLFALYSEADTVALYPLVLLGVAFHGICFDFFFAAGFIYVDSRAPSDIRGSGQALFTFLTYGVGMWIGGLVAGWLGDFFKSPLLDAVGRAVVNSTGDPETVTNWSAFWIIPAAGVLACFAAFVLCFRDVSSSQQMPTAMSPNTVPAGWEGDDPLNFQKGGNR